MERKHKITIPEPCHENWDKMTPKENGRFCLSCSKTVIDFTSMLAEEIQHFFIENQNTNICGRFKDEQLESLIIQIPSRILCTQTQYHKMFLLALFIVMGTTLFSCTNKDGKKQKIDNIEVTDDPSAKKPIIMGGLPLPEHDQKDSLNQIQFSSKTDPKDCSEKLTPKITMGVLIAPNVPFKYDIIYNSNDLDILPVPENGMKKFHEFFDKNYAVSNKTDKFQGKILFVIEKDGSLSNFNIIKNTSTASGEEVIRVLKMAPKWIPGKLNDRIVRTSYILPISFKK